MENVAFTAEFSACILNTRDFHYLSRTENKSILFNPLGPAYTQFKIVSIQACP